MKNSAITLAVCGALMACSGGGGSGSGGSGQIAPIPTAEQRYTGDVTSITYDPDTDTLNVQGDPFDLSGAFRRVPGRDVRGFAAFENVGGARRYLALVRTDADYDLAAGVVGTPIRLDSEFGGTMLARGETPEMPREVEVTHVGSYAGVRNVGTNVGADTSGALLQRTEGRVRLDLDFFADQRSADGARAGSIEGVIFDRRSMDEVVFVNGRRQPVTLDDVVLVFTAIDAQGNFSGTANGLSGGTGTFDGMIAGEGAAASAGVVVFGTERGAFIARAQ